MSGILPRFVTPSDVRALKNRLDPVVTATDATVSWCQDLDEPTRQSWGEFRRAWQTYRDEEDSWIHTAAQMDAGEAFEVQIAGWQRLLSTRCTPRGPQLEPAKPQDLSGTIKVVAVAGGVIAVALLLRGFLK